MRRTLPSTDMVVQLKRDELPGIRVLDSKLAQNRFSPEFIPKLVGPDGDELVLPPSVYTILKQAVHVMAQGQPISIVPIEHELTTQEAADLLNVSRPFLVKLLEGGKIPFHEVGSHRRVRFADLVTYKKDRDKARRTALKEITEISEALGLYDDESEEK